MFAKGYVPSPVRTGYETVVAHRTSDLFATTAQQDGVVKTITGKSLVVEYKDGTKQSVELGRRFGSAAGQTFPHQLVTDLKAGDSFKAGDVVCYNSQYFTPDLLNPTQVLWKAGVLVRTAVMECADTLEDSSVISERVAELLTTQATKPRDVVVRFGQTVRDVIEVGATVGAETILCTIEDPVTANSDLFDESSIDMLRLLAGQNPKSKYVGKVEKVEVYYNGDLEDMSPSLRMLAEASDKARASLQKSLGRNAINGRVDSTLRVDGNPLEIDELTIRFYITTDVPAGVGDKGVFANQLKTIFGRVMAGTNTTESGEPLDALFSNDGISRRIVQSPYLIGTTNTLLKVLSKHVAATYRGGR